MADDFDNFWKEALKDFFDPCLLLLFPDVHSLINWNRTFEFLEQELRRIQPEGEVDRRHVDVLVRVWLLDGSEEWLLIHVEVQTQRESAFPLRMFRYFARIFDGYERMPMSLAILADDDRNWTPGRFELARGGCWVAFDFPTAKLIDFSGERRQLEGSDNPFALVVLAHLDTLETQNNTSERSSRKFALAKALCRRGYTAIQIRRLFQLIDMCLRLPESDDRRWWNDWFAQEEVEKMPHVLGIERYAREEGLSQGLSQGRTEGRREALLDALSDIAMDRFAASDVELLLAKARTLDESHLRQLIRTIDKSPTAEAAIRKVIDIESE